MNSSPTFSAIPIPDGDGADCIGQDARTRCGLRQLWKFFPGYEKRKTPHGCETSPRERFARCYSISDFRHIDCSLSPDSSEGASEPQTYITLLNPFLPAASARPSDFEMTDSFHPNLKNFAWSASLRKKPRFFYTFRRYRVTRPVFQGNLELVEIDALLDFARGEI